MRTAKFTELINYLDDRYLKSSKVTNVDMRRALDSWRQLMLYAKGSKPLDPDIGDRLILLGWNMKPWVGWQELVFIMHLIDPMFVLEYEYLLFYLDQAVEDDDWSTLAEIWRVNGTNEVRDFLMSVMLEKGKSKKNGLCLVKPCVMSLHEKVGLKGYFLDWLGDKKLSEPLLERLYHLASWGVPMDEEVGVGVVDAILRCPQINPIDRYTWATPVAHLWRGRKLTRDEHFLVLGEFTRGDARGLPWIGGADFIRLRAMVPSE